MKYRSIDDLASDIAMALDSSEPDGLMRKLDLILERRMTEKNHDLFEEVRAHLSEACDLLTTRPAS